MVTTLTAFPFNLTPLTNISPFTYRDGITYLEKLEFLQKYIVDTLVPGANAALDDLLAQVQALIDTLGTEITDNRTEIEALIAGLLVDVTALVDANLAMPAPLPGGGTNDEVALNAYFALHPGQSVTLWPLTYVISAPLNPAGLRELNGNGATIDTSNIPAGSALAQRYALRSAGTLGDPVTLVSAIAAGSTQVPGVPEGAFSVGDTVLVSNTDVAAPGLTLANRYLGELNTVQAIALPTVLTLASGALFDYGTTGLTVRKVNTVNDLTVHGLTFTGSGVGDTLNGIEVQYGKNITIRDNRIDGCEDVAISLKSVLGYRVEGNHVTNSTSSLTYGSTGYGVGILDGSRDGNVFGNFFERCRHFVAGGGVYPPVFADVHHNHGRYASSYGFEGHESCYWWNIHHNTSEHATHGFFFRGQYGTIENNRVVDATQEAIGIHAFNDVTVQRGVRVLNNVVVRSGYGISATNVEDIEIRGNRLNNAGTNPIRVTAFNGAVVADNVTLGGTGHSIRLEGTPLLQATRLSVSNNTVKTAGDNALDIRYVDDVVITGGMADTPGQYPLEIVACNRTQTSNYQGRNGGYGGIYVHEGGNHTISNPSMTGSTNPTYADGVRANLTHNVTINGGYFAQARWAVYTTETQNVIISGINAVDNSASLVKVDDFIDLTVVNKIIKNNLPASINI